MKNVTSITPMMLEKFEENYAANQHLSVLSNLLSTQILPEAAFNQTEANKLRMDFAIEVPTTGITAQKQSGRCWMFATMNVARERVVQKCNMKEFALSGAYLAFYDKLEKGNNFFEAVLHYAADPIDSRENKILFTQAIADGGQWDMAVSLLEKYGCVPEWVMPETVHSTGTSNWKDVIDEKMRENALELRRMARAGKETEERRTEMLAEYYNMLCLLYGSPVKTFDFEYKDKDGVYHVERDLTPKKFYEEYVGADLQDYFGMLSAPHLDFGRLYSQPFMGDIVEDDILMANISMDELEALAIEQLKSGEVVFFSCDCHAFKERARGYWAKECFDYEGTLGGITFGMNKREKLITGTSTMNHCMVLCGVNFDKDGKPDRWKIENSWGDANGQKGYFICSESWFREYVYQIVVRKSFLNKDQKMILTQHPTPMVLWDPVA
ncbi:MAG: C1 family peptidase [Dorea sp.]|nr:C1 family peptidase [Dorea sp.]